MGIENDAILSYLENNGRFADLFNQCFFGGKQWVKPQELKEGSEVYTPSPKSNRRPRIRDIKRRLESGACLKVLAVEAQSDVSYIMPWRIMEYDCREYEKQIRKIQSANQSAEESGRKGIYASTGERLWRYRREDRIAPVYTICLYHGQEKWDGPKGLKDMVDFAAGCSEAEKRDWESRFIDYPMRLICANEPMDCSGFRTSLGAVFALLPFRSDRAGLKQMLDKNPSYGRLDEETAETIGILMGVEGFMEHKEEYKKGETYNLCQAIREMIEDGRMEGLKEGMKEEKTNGLRIFIRSNRDDGVADETIAEKLQKYYSLNKEEAWEALSHN